MCVVSMVGDHYAEKWKDREWIKPLQPGRVLPVGWPPHVDEGTRIDQPISRREFAALKRDVEEMKKLLKRAKEYDERNNEPDCEIDEKMKLLRKVAEMVGVSLDDVIGKGN